MVSNIEVDAYAKHKSMLKEKIQKAYYQLLVKLINLMKIKLKHIIARGQSSATFDVLYLVNIIKYIGFSFKYKKYLPFIIHKIYI